jgi:ribulose-phosphate 3-epimerase
VLHLHRAVAAIKETGARAGVALNPATPFNLLDDILAELDLVLVMSVNPGFSGQKFIPGALRKIRQARERKDTQGHHYLIEIDGGMNGQTAPGAVAAGAEVIVAGNGIFSHRSYRRAIGSLRGQ